MHKNLGTGGLIYIAIGVVIALTHNFFNSAVLTTLSGLLSGLLAVVAWPLVLLGIHVAI